jgi:hypothetical protein
MAGNTKVCGKPGTDLKWAVHTDPNSKARKTELFLLSRDVIADQFDQDQVFETLGYAVWVNNLEDMFEKLCAAKRANQGQDFDAVTIVGHAKPGVMRIGVDYPGGAGQISLASQSVDKFKMRFQGLKLEGELTLLGCFLAQHFSEPPALEDDGEELVRQLAAAIQRPVTAAAFSFDSGDFDDDGLLPWKPDRVFRCGSNGEDRPSEPSDG